MEIVRITPNSKRAGIEVRASLARLNHGTSHTFLSPFDVRDFLSGRSKLDFKTANVISTANKAVVYIERFANTKSRVRRVDHIVALLVLYSEDSLGTGVLSSEFHKTLRGMQDVMDKVVENGYSGVKMIVALMSFINENNFLYERSPDVIYLLYNFLLFQDGYALILQDTDQLDVSLSMRIGYKVRNFAKSLN